MHQLVLLAFFFLSGISGLIYQIAWVRQATFTFGVSIYAYSAVISAFMIGLALGSWALGKKIDRSARPLRVYGWLEVGIALLAALTPFLLDLVHGVFPGLTNAFPGAALTPLRLLFSLLVLTPTTFMIGATLPVMSRIYATRSGRVGSDVGRLYLINTLGAATGCLLTGLVLLKVLGLRETIYLGAAINLAVALGAFVLDRVSASDTAVTASAPDEASERDAEARTPASSSSASAGGLSPRALRFVAGAYGVSGFIAIAYEVVWARILYIHSAHAVYSFALMLAVFLTGLAVGSWAGTVWIRRRPATLIQFGVAQLAIALLAICVLLVFSMLPAWHLEIAFGGTTIEYELLVAFITMFPPTFVMGLLFPIVSSLYTGERTDHLGLNIGLVNALNTVGGIVGSLATGFLLVPLVGLQRTTMLLAALNLVIGIRAFGIAGATGLLRTAPVIAAVVVGAAAILLPRGMYLGSHYDDEDRVVFYEEGPETTVAVLDFPERNFKISFVNGRDEVPTDEISMLAFRLLGHLPVLANPDAQSALMLSFGNGIATGTLNTHGIARIDAVDLSREMTRAARVYSTENFNVLDSESLTLHIEDGRNFLLRTPDLYDIITVDATHPANASSWALFTREFYQLIETKMAQGGVFMQWIPIHGLSEEDYRNIITTVTDVFPHTTLWTTGGSHSYVLSTREPFTQREYDGLLQRASENERVMRDLGSPIEIGRYVAMSGQTLARYVLSGTVVTDNTAYFMPIEE